MSWLAIPGYQRTCCLGIMLFAVLVVLAPLSANARPLPVLASSPGDHVGERMEYLELPDNTLALEDVRKLPDRHWTRSDDEIPSFGYTSDTHWFRFHLKNDEARQARLVLELGYSLLDSVTFYQLDDGELVQETASGDGLPFSERDVKHRSFVFPVSISPGETHEIYLKVRTSSSLQVPLKLWEEDTFYENDQFTLLGNGLYYGIVLVMAFYNFFLFLRLRDPAYLYYVLYVSNFALIQFSISGFSYQFLWPSLPGWNEQSIAVLVPTVVIWAALFLRRSLLRPGVHPWFERSWQWLAVACGVLAVLATFMPYHLAIRAGIVMGIAACVLALYMSYYVWLKDRHKYAAYISVAWSVFLIGVVILSLNKFGIIPRTFLTESAAQIGSALEVILLSYALAERLNDANRKQLRSQLEATEATERLFHLEREHRVQLEEEVRHRTQELQEALGKVGKLNEELYELSHTDQLTGARNRRFFDEYLTTELRRGYRSKKPLSLLMLDIDHFKSVNDNYGHGIGDKCLKRVVAVISEQLHRAQDEVCRYGGEEIAVVLPETDSEGALTVASNIRAAVEALRVETSQGPLQVTASLGVSTVPGGADRPPQRLLEEADQALYVAKAEGRNRVRVFSESVTSSGPALPR